eukprot:COSAG02_NODE_48_length_45421_cov_103.222100_1_plen_338_part_00
MAAAVPGLPVPGLFGGSFDTVTEALANAQQAHNLDLSALLRTWHLVDGTADAARVCRCAQRCYAQFQPLICGCWCILCGSSCVAATTNFAAFLCRCIRAAVRAETLGGGSIVGMTAEPVEQGWTASGWEQADELRLLRKDGSLVVALAEAGNAATSASGRGCTAWRSAEFDGDEPLVKYSQPLPQPASTGLPSALDVGGLRDRRTGGRGLFACCGKPARSTGNRSLHPTPLTVVGSLRAATEGPHVTDGPDIHAKPTAKSAVLRRTTVGEELQSTGEARAQGRHGAEWVQVEWAEEQPLEAGGQFAGTVTVRATGWVLTQADGVLFLERSVYYNARK